MKENRTTKNGYWKESDVDEVPIQASHGEKVGVKKFLVFCLGVPPTGNKTSWVMEEYKICNTSGFSAAVYKKRGKQKLVSFLCIYINNIYLIFCNLNMKLLTN